MRIYTSFRIAGRTRKRVGGRSGGYQGLAWKVRRIEVTDPRGEAHTLVIELPIHTNYLEVIFKIQYRIRTHGLMVE